MVLNQEFLRFNRANATLQKCDTSVGDESGLLSAFEFAPRCPPVVSAPEAKRLSTSACIQVRWPMHDGVPSSNGIVTGCAPRRVARYERAWLHGFSRAGMGAHRSDATNRLIRQFGPHETDR